MSKILVFCGAVVVTVVTVLSVALAGVPMRDVLSLLLGALCLLWLLVLLTVPWNLYFQARGLIHEIRVSRERGIPVAPDQEPEARRIARLMRWFAIGAHVASAALVALITYLSGGAVGYYFAGLFLLSTFFRPAGAYFGYLRKQLSQMLREVKYPRDDLVDVLARLDHLTTETKALRLLAGEHDRSIARTRDRLDTVDGESRARDQACTTRSTPTAASSSTPCPASPTTRRSSPA
jgi:hypothetical protein